MNTQNKSLLSNLSKADTAQLTTIVSETIALVAKETKNFTAADLWNRSFVQRRYNAA